MASMFTMFPVDAEEPGRIDHISQLVEAEINRVSVSRKSFKKHIFPVGLKPSNIGYFNSSYFGPDLNEEPFFVIAVIKNFVFIVFITFSVLMLNCFIKILLQM